MTSQKLFFGKYNGFCSVVLNDLCYERGSLSKNVSLVHQRAEIWAFEVQIAPY